MIIEQEKQLQDVQKALNDGDSLWIPMYSDPFAHYANNSISFIYIYSIPNNNWSICIRFGCRLNLSNLAKNESFIFSG